MITRQKFNILATAAGALILLVTTGCHREVDTPNNTPVNTDSVFDFSTRETYTLNLKYDVPEGYSIYFEVYTEDPEELDADGQIVKRKIEPVDAGFTDAKGVYNHKISVPSTAKQLYVYSPYAGVPRMLVAQINNGVLSEFGYRSGTAAMNSVATRADDDYKDKPYNQLQTLKRLGYWINSTGKYYFNNRYYDLYGRPDYVNSESITVSSDILRLVNQTVPEGGGVDAALVRNGDIHVTERANIDLYLIDEATSANNTLAYYCYPTGNPPTTKAEIKDIVIAFPNAKVLKYHDYYPNGYNGAVQRGEGVRLHYWKDGVDLGDEFPEGVSIGWVIYNQSYETCCGSSNNKLNEKASHFFADKKFNDNGRGHVVLFRSGDKVIFGFEDWPGDYDYNDVVFYVKSNPIEAITPEIPEVKPEEPDDSEIVSNVTYRGILAFEDLWPSRGDFDMNDVVVGYESVVSYNKSNEVIQTADQYTILSSGATINNSFAYQLDALRGEVEVEVSSSLGGDGGAYVDQTLDKATVRLANGMLSYANNDTKTTFTVMTKYTGRRIAKDDFTKPPYNPFITTSDIDKEVHMTNMRPTEKLNKERFGMGHDKSNPILNLYYITYDEMGQQMPFAINIAFENKDDMKAFVIPKESVRIDVYYPTFINWVKTNGRMDADWYLHPKRD